MTLLSAFELSKNYPIKKGFKTQGQIHAVSGVSFELGGGETLAIVGESGCGKSTLARLLLGLESPSSGSLKIEGKERPKKLSLQDRKKVQMVFQDPYGSLNPRMKVWQLISEPLRIHQKLSASEARQAAIAWMEKVGLNPEQADRYPHMFSGGQRQRIGIARALTLRPQVLLCDEPVSALDVSIQAQVLNLLKALQKEFALAMIFISHDLSVVRHVADRIAVMYLGHLVEIGTTQEIFESPQHPYTRALLASAPKFLIGSHNGPPLTDSATPKLLGEPPSPLHPPSGCAFRTRCPLATEHCAKEKPTLTSLGDQRGPSHQVACWNLNSKN